MAGAASIIVGRAIRAGREEEFLSWHRDATDAASRFPGYLSSELSRPSEEQPDWTAVYRFDSAANARHWLDSPTRQDLLDDGAPFFDGPATLQILADESEVRDALVSVVVSHRVPADEVGEFLDWQEQVAESQRTFPGFRAVEVFRPIDGVQGEWTICMKFDSAEHLDAWLTSDQRTRLLRASPFGDFTLRRIDHSFGNWFSLGDQAAKPPSNAKTTIAVWMGLYPTVMFLTLMTMPFHLPMWANMLVGNLLSSFVMSYFTMPYYSNPILGWWLRPSSGAPQPRTDLVGIAIVLAITAAWAVFFIVVTRAMHLH